QFYRDNRLNAIHEGTHGIQALDLLGRKVVMQNGAALQLLGKRISATVALAADSSHPDTRLFATQLAEYNTRLTKVTQSVWSAGNIDHTLANATAFLEAFGHVVVAWMWLEQSLAASKHYAAGESDFYHGKWQACRYFFVAELPKAGPLLDLVQQGDTTSFDMQPNWF
ncbi:MAG: acyl-CoA dehydrogenase, partial [Aeromicrobium sp.]|nr:acyl-CoA dehydrogenase [Burkholderiales bacterium]